jgi:hypothetical protein
MIESALDKLAQQILGLDEASLSSLWEKYRKRMEHFEPTNEWEKAVIIFFIINSVRAKNHIFNEQLMRQQGPRDPSPKGKSAKGKPELKLVKS